MALPKSLSHSSLTAPYGLGPLGVAAGIFFMMGFVTWLNGPLISFVRVAFSLGDVAAFMVPMVFYISYFIFSIPASFLARSLGLRKGLSVALLLCALGVATFGQFVSGRQEKRSSPISYEQLADREWAREAGRCAPALKWVLSPCDVWHPPFYSRPPVCFHTL